jgi:hypothetical protein
MLSNPDFNSVESHLIIIIATDIQISTLEAAALNRYLWSLFLGAKIFIRIFQQKRALE